MSGRTIPRRDGSTMKRTFLDVEMLHAGSMDGDPASGSSPRETVPAFQPGLGSWRPLAPRVGEGWRTMRRGQSSGPSRISNGQDGERSSAAYERFSSGWGRGGKMKSFAEEASQENTPTQPQDHGVDEGRATERHQRRKEHCCDIQECEKKARRDSEVDRLLLSAAHREAAYQRAEHEAILQVARTVEEIKIDFTTLEGRIMEKLQRDRLCLEESLSQALMTNREKVERLAELMLLNFHEQGEDQNKIAREILDAVSRSATTANSRLAEEFRERLEDAVHGILSEMKIEGAGALRFSETKQEAEFEHYEDPDDDIFSTSFW